jgi:hypothetical protein
MSRLEEARALANETLAVGDRIEIIGGGMAYALPLAKYLLDALEVVEAAYKASSVNPAQVFYLRKALSRFSASQEQRSE